MLKITPLNEKAANEGQWTNYRGVDLLIARANTDKYKEAFRSIMKPYQRQIEDESLPEEKSMDLLCTVMGRHILLDWKNFPDFNGVKGSTVEYSTENAKDLLMSDTDCFLFVKDFSEDLNNYLLEEDRRFKGKSGTPSAGT